MGRLTTNTNANNTGRHWLRVAYACKINSSGDDINAWILRRPLSCNSGICFTAHYNFVFKLFLYFEALTASDVGKFAVLGRNPQIG